MVGLDDVGSIIIDLIREGRRLLTNSYQVRNCCCRLLQQLSAAKQSITTLEMVSTRCLCLGVQLYALSHDLFLR